MMRYTKGGAGPRLALLLHHDDDERELAHDREFTLSPLSEALDQAANLEIEVGAAGRGYDGAHDSVHRFPYNTLKSFGAGGENRTRDIQLGKLTFYL